MNKDLKKYGYYMVITLITGAIICVISARINAAYPQENEFFDYQMYLLIIAVAVIGLIISIFFREFKKRGEL